MGRSRADVGIRCDAARESDHTVVMPASAAVQRTSAKALI